MKGTSVCTPSAQYRPAVSGVADETGTAEMRSEVETSSLVEQSFRYTVLHFTLESTMAAIEVYK